MNTQIKFTTAAEAVKVIKSGDHIHLSSVASAPQCLIKAMCERGANHEFKDVHIHHLHTEGPAPYADPQFEGIFQLDSFFVGGNVRKVTQSGYADYIPIFLSETQKLYRSGTVPCDVAMIQVSTPDKHGYVSLGTSVDATLAAVETARTVIAVVNKHVPRSFGDAMIHSSKIDLFVQDDTPLEEAHFTEPNEIETRIGKHCAALIEDGATLQMGIGAIPNAVLAQLGNHKNLGIHTEMFADGVLPLVEKGVINGEAKNIDKGKMVSTFLMGSQRVYDFIDDNPGVLMMDVGYTNDPFIIAKKRPRNGHQLGTPGGYHRSGLRRFAGYEILFGCRRPDRLHLRRFAVERRQGDYRHAFGDQQRHLEDRSGTDLRRRRGNHPQPHPLVRHRKRRRQSLRQKPAGACAADHLDRRSFGPGIPGPGSIRALRTAPPLREKLHGQIINLPFKRKAPDATSGAFFTFGRDRPIYRLCGIRTLARAFENNTPDGQYEIFAPKNRKVCFPADFSTHNL